MRVFPPPRTALLTGTKVMLALMPPVVVAAALFGEEAILPAAMGLLAAAVVPSATRRQAMILVPALALTGALAASVHGNPVATVVVVVVACLAAGLLSVISAGIFATAPTVVAVLALDGADGFPAWAVGVAMLAVGAYVTIIIWLLKFQLPARPVPPVVAGRHAAVMAVACGTATAFAVHYDWFKAYWLVMTLAIILRPYAGESLTKTQRRIVGTVLGAAIAALLSPLPRPWQLLFAAVCMALMFAYMTMQKYTLQVTFTTPMVIFLVSTGTVTSTLALDGLRLLYTASACVIGGLLALALARAPEPAEVT